MDDSRGDFGRNDNQLAQEAQTGLDGKQKGHRWFRGLEDE